jgi:hypothetical protein
VNCLGPWKPQRATGADVATSRVFTKQAQRFEEGANITLVDGGDRDFARNYPNIVRRT